MFTRLNRHRGLKAATALGAVTLLGISCGGAAVLRAFIEGQAFTTGLDGRVLAYDEQVCGL